MVAVAVAIVRMTNDPQHLTKPACHSWQNLEDN